MSLDINVERLIEDKSVLLFLLVDLDGNEVGKKLRSVDSKEEAGWLECLLPMAHFDLCRDLLHGTGQSDHILIKTMAGPRLAEIKVICHLWRRWLDRHLKV